MSSLEKRAEQFLSARQTRSLEAAEDYTELVADLIREKGEARTCDIAKHLGVSHVTVVKTIQRLQSEGFLHTSRHQPVELTKKGEKTARYSKRRHELLLEFFTKIGVPRKTAEVDVEGMEHHVSARTLAAIRKFVRGME